MKKYLIIGIVVLVGAIGGFAFYFTSHPFTAGANPGFLSYTPCYIDGLTSARTGLVQIPAGLATSTIGVTTACDVTLGNNTVPKALNLTLLHEASSSPASLISFDIQMSMDGTNWASEPAQTFTSVTATTTKIIYNPLLTRSYQQLASTTDKLTSLVTGTTTVLFQIPNPDRARYFKVLFYTPVGSQASRIWAELRPVKEQN